MSRRDFSSWALVLLGLAILIGAVAGECLPRLRPAPATVSGGEATPLPLTVLPTAPTDPLPPTPAPSPAVTEALPRYTAAPLPPTPAPTETPVPPTETPRPPAVPVQRG